MPAIPTSQEEKRRGTCSFFGEDAAMVGEVRVSVEKLVVVGALPAADVFSRGGERGGIERARVEFDCDVVAGMEENENLLEKFDGKGGDVIDCGWGAMLESII